LSTDLRHPPLITAALWPLDINYDRGIECAWCGTVVLGAPGDAHFKFTPAGLLDALTGHACQANAATLGAAGGDASAHAVSPRPFPRRPTGRARAGACDGR
jgi:hypothetical protein